MMVELQVFMGTFRVESCLKAGCSAISMAVETTERRSASFASMTSGTAAKKTFVAPILTRGIGAGTPRQVSEAAIKSA